MQGKLRDQITDAQVCMLGWGSFIVLIKSGPITLLARNMLYKQNTEGVFSEMEVDSRQGKEFWSIPCGSPLMENSGVAIQILHFQGRKLNTAIFTKQKMEYH